MTPLQRTLLDSRGMLQGLGLTLPTTPIPSDQVEAAASMAIDLLSAEVARLRDQDERRRQAFNRLQAEAKRLRAENARLGEEADLMRFAAASFADGVIRAGTDPFEGTLFGCNPADPRDVDQLVAEALRRRAPGNDGRGGAR